MIAVTCPSCGRKLKVKDELGGKRGKCPQCQQTVAIPRAEAVSGDVGRTQGGARADVTGRDAPNAATLPPASSVRVEHDAKTTAPGVPPAMSGATVTNEGKRDADVPAAELYDFLAPAQAADELGRLGTYRVLKLLGAGGMGAVFQAEDPQLKRRVALKVMLPALAASESSRKRFLREAQAAAAISHDHIVHIYQVGEDRGVPFIAMQFLEGESLEDRLQRERRLEVEEVLRIGRETALGLAAAQQRGMIHRDIKPANLWLEGDQGRVKILDFGLARAATEEANLTQQGAIIGTPAYMSPEQAAGKPADGRSDLFSVGCVLYRMSTGRVPFKGANTVSTLVAVATEHPTPPRELNRRIPAALSDLVMELLEKEPNARLQSAQELAKALAALQRDPGGHAATTVRRTGKSRKSRSAGRRWPMLAAIGGGVAAIALVLILLAGGFRGSGIGPDEGKDKVSDLGNRDKGQADKAGKEPPDPAKEAAALNRKAADWVLNRGGKVTVAHLKGGAGSVVFSKATSLPAKAFWVQTIELPRAGIDDDALDNLSGLTELEALHLAGNSIRGAGLQFLRKATKLKRLDLADTSLADDGLKYLEPLKALGELNLLQTPASETSIQALKSALSACTILTERVVAKRILELRGQIGIGTITDLKDGKIPLIDKVTQLPKERFRIALIRLQPMGPPGPGSTITDADFKLIGGVTSLKNLEFFNIPSPPSGLAHLAGLKQLDSFVLPNAVPKGTFQALEGMKALRMLVLNDSGISNAELSTVKGLRNLDILVLIGTPISDAGMLHLQSLTNLRQLDLTRTEVGDKGLAALADLTELKRLALSHTRVTGSGLAKLSKLTKLSQLMLDNTPLQDKELAHCKNLAGLSNLNLSDTKITGAGLEALRGTPKLFALTLANTLVADDGLKYLSDLPNLRFLHLNGTRVTNTGLEHLGKLTGLTMLDLSQTAVTDAGLKHLRPLTKLQSLHLVGTKVTENAVRDLKTALPKCIVHLK